MMEFRDLDIHISYAGKGDVILRQFLLPTISNAIRYDRVTSFYTVESLLAISQGIESLYTKQGKMRLIIGIHSVPEEFIDAVTRREYLKNQISEIRKNLTQGIESITDNLEKRRLATVAWMIEDNLLEIKAANVKGDGIFHPKTLILEDELGNRIAAIGSPNETGSGLGGNFEQVMVAKSWEQEDAVAVQEKFFDDLWNNTQEGAITMDITEDTADLIRSSLGPSYSKTHRRKTSGVDLIAESAAMLSNFFVSGDIPALYMHQERAVIDALSRWPVRVLFSDEVGLGKTFEVAATMSFMIKYCGIKRVLILTPKSVLKQWQDELYNHFKLNVWRYDSGEKAYVDYLGRQKYVGSSNPIGPSAPNIILMSAQYARGNGDNGDIFSREGACLPELLILDEAHSARVSRDMLGEPKKTQIYRMIERVSRRIPHIILATATPMQKEAGEYHSLLKLLGLPKGWQKEKVYLNSLDLISRDGEPSLSELSNAAKLLLTTLDEMHPSAKRLSSEQVDVLNQLTKLKDADITTLTDFVREHWAIIRQLLIVLHPAHLLTVRNTRRSLSDMGYKFPKRNLTPVSIGDSMEVELFYEKLNQYLSYQCFSIEEVLFPDRKISIGFVRVSYQQRVASSLFSCKRSLERRLEKVNYIKNSLKQYLKNLSIINPWDADDDDLDEMLGDGIDDTTSINLSNIDIKALRQAIALESTTLTPLIKSVSALLDESKDLKIKESIKLAKQCLNNRDKVLLFSRYTDTIEALLNEFRIEGLHRFYSYGIYTGNQSCIVNNGDETPCDKNDLKRSLFSGEIKIVFCSDAASEGLNLQAARVLINVDVPWTPARLEQRVGRVARLGQVANEVDIYNVWYPNSIEARMYHRIQRRLENSNLAIGEFPDVVAKKIRTAIMNGEDSDNTGLNELLEIRNSKQVAALEELWSQNVNETESDLMRRQLLQICTINFKTVDEELNGLIKVLEMPDDSTIRLSATSGMAESISLKSDVWDYIQFKEDSVQIIKDSESRPMCFGMSNHGVISCLKHTSVPKIILNQPLDSSDIIKGYPKMLPDSRNLDLSYAVEIPVKQPPIYWEK